MSSETIHNVTYDNYDDFQHIFTNFDFTILKDYLMMKLTLA
jgi:hypothetical protein